MYQPTERLELDFLDASVSLESVCREFSLITDLEHFSISQEALEVSMEENVYGGRPNAAGLVVSGAVNYAKRMERKAFQKAGEVAGKTARGEYGLIANKIYIVDRWNNNNVRTVFCCGYGHYIDSLFQWCA